MPLTAFCIMCSVLYLVHAQDCVSQFQYDYNAGTNMTVNITEACNEKPCITKCCPANQILVQHPNGSLTCNTTTNLTLHDYSDVEIYNRNVKQEILKTGKKFEQFTLIYNKDFHNRSCSSDIAESYPPSRHKLYILEDGSLSVRRLHYYNQWKENYSPELFCVEHLVIVHRDGTTNTRLVIRNIERPASIEELESFTDPKISFASYGMLVSSFFLVLVLVVYALLPQLRNLAGMMLMSYVATLTTAFVFRAVHIIGSDNDVINATGCLYVGLIMYYTMLASFTCMNVMSFDIWWTMRGFRKLRQIHRRGILVKFAWYSLYAWGAPLVPVLFIIIVEHIDLMHLPNFIKPHLFDVVYCFMGEDERQLYMNGPILIATCINITLFLMTAYNIWRIKNGVSKHSAGESRRNKKDETRFGIYLKLSLVMGINWILEVVSAVYATDSPIWYIPDIFNCLVGVFIFIIFVCKRSVILLLCKRFSIENDFVRRWQPMDSTRTESSRLNSKRKMQDSMTSDTSDVEGH